MQSVGAPLGAGSTPRVDPRHLPGDEAARSEPDWSRRAKSGHRSGPGVKARRAPRIAAVHPRAPRRGKTAEEHQAGRRTHPRSRAGNGRHLPGCRAFRRLRLSAMRVVLARCSVTYVGRLTAELPSALRLLMVKADGCVAVHADGGAYKPLNWMNAPNTFVEDEGRWVVTNPKGETLEVVLDEVLLDVTRELGEDPGLSKDGVEAHLQQLLAAHPDVLAPEDGLRLVRREYPTDIGPVDLLCRDGEGIVVAVEIKRRGEIDGVDQLTRYLERLNRDPMLAPVRGIFAAQRIKPQAKTLARERGIACVEVDYDELRGVESDELRLF